MTFNLHNSYAYNHEFDKKNGLMSFITDLNFFQEVLIKCVQRVPVFSEKEVESVE